MQQFPIIKLAQCVVLVYLVGSLWDLVSCSPCDDLTNGGTLVKNLVVNKWDTPCVIQKDLLIASKYTLRLMAGTELRFMPGVMLAVNGTLIADGAVDDRVLLTKNSAPSNISDAGPKWPDDIRLVDDFSVTLGRLQIKYRNKWRGVCANNVNWTQTDVDVACQQLGFQTGNFSFFNFALNETAYMLYYNPGCNGSEKSILDCPGGKYIQIGSGICRYQRTLALRCFGLKNNSEVLDNWWGLEFYNSSAMPSLNGFISINESLSMLRNVDIQYAGVTKQGFPVPAVRASPSIPSLVNVTIKHCALDATNFTMVMSSTIVYNSEMTNNRGHGLSVETILGHVEVRNSRMIQNYGNGIKAKFLDRSFFVVDDLLTFCSLPNLVIQTFPQVITGIPQYGLVSSCGRKFESQYGQRLTFNVVDMEIEPTANATLDLFDGRDATAPLIASYKLYNGTLPMGVTTTFYYLYVRFNWAKPVDRCPTLRDCVKFTIIVDSSPDSTPEFYMNSTLVSGNLQHGVFLENARNYIVINASTINYNNYGAGVRLIGGAGDLLINASRVEYNRDNGVNITYDGGWRIFNQSSFSYNYGHGINITFNETSVDNKTRYTRHQKTHVSRSQFILNDGYGIRVGNYCRYGQAIVNDSIFTQNGRSAVEFESCFLLIPWQNSTNFTVGYNRFDGNKQYAIKAAPLINAVGTIANNTFVNHPRFTILLDNSDDFLHNLYYLDMLVDYSIITNRFEGNSGHYVAFLRLSEGSQRQRMMVNYNVFVKNFVTGMSPVLNERTQAHAVVILSSSNINFTRNHLENPDSEYEMATQEKDMSIMLEARMQWWGTTDYSKVITRLFDQFERYNLARIIYHPALNSAWLYTPVLTDRNEALEIQFQRGNTLGGRLTEELHLPPGDYLVDRDMSVSDFGRLYVSPGTSFHFQNCLGLLVQGYVSITGSSDSPVLFNLTYEDTWINNTLVRLSDGPSIYEGRLEVRASEDHEWSTICSDGWTIEDASVACRQMGLVVQQVGWQVMIADIQGSVDQTILRSNVRCTSLDVDILLCDADDENDHSCNHTKDVYVKCIAPNWAGIRFLANAVPSVLTYSLITGAGLLDPATVSNTAAIKIDYNSHRLENLLISDNIADGLHIVRNDVFSNARLANSIVRNNVQNGVRIQGSFFEINNCNIVGNGAAGFSYKPAYTTYEALQLRAGVTNSLIWGSNMSIYLGREAVQWVTTKQKFDPESTIYQLSVQVDPLYRVVVDLIDYNPLTDSERFTAYDSRNDSITPSTLHWTVEEDLPDFPVVSQLTFFTLRWVVTGVASGRLAFVIRSKAWDWRWPFALISIKNSTLEGNLRGMTADHYNQPSNEFLDLFQRFRWEKINLYGVQFLRNKYEAIASQSVTRWNLLYLPSFDVLQDTLKVAEITYNVEACYFAENGLGVDLTHNTVEFSNNVWIYQLSGCLFERNKEGGFTIELPRVNLMYTELYNHSVDINQTVFQNNDNFDFRIDGFYCNASIENNLFQQNRCKLGCVTISGTEKDFDMHDNQFIENVGTYIVLFYMNSHTPYTRWVDSKFSYNLLKRNQKPPAINTTIVTPSSRPTSFTVGVRGLQNMTINRNLFGNYLDFELLGGQTSSLLENYLDVTENYWGTTDQQQIRKVIFDFDDWNNFAIVEYFPFLLYDTFDSRVFVGQKYQAVLDLSLPLGGRITENLNLKKRSTPYIVHRDLTVMEGVSLIIDAGVELQFYPSIGILVLGSLIVNGDPNDKVKFGPILKSLYASPQTSSSMPLQNNTGLSTLRSSSAGGVKSSVVISHPDVDSQLGYQLRLVGGSDKDEGFLEIYNTTEHQWSIVCDRAFNERTAEVACKTMGKEWTNVVVTTNAYFDIFVLGYPKMHEQLLEWFWRETLICDGSENTLNQCRHRLNYNLYEDMMNHLYVYVKCGARNLPQDYDYWGNIRFTTSAIEFAAISPGFSSMYNLDIYGAGILHDDRVAAVQSVSRVPESYAVRIHNSDYHGYDYIAPMDKFRIRNNLIQNNNGYAINVMVLSGATSDIPQSQFAPLIENGVPYDVQGLIRMCTTEKLIYVVDRLLLYYKYDFETIDCIKVLRSKEPRKMIGIRFLQMQLYNDTKFENTIEMYNGEYFDPRMMIGKITVNSSSMDIKTLYSTSSYYDTMGIRVTGSPAFGNYGFIAEVVTLPLSPIWRPDYGPGNSHVISNNLITDNLGGGFIFQNVGENNIRLSFESNYMENCGWRILNNTFPGVVNVYIQNTKILTIANNYIVRSAGGIRVNTTTRDNDVSLYSNITNNIIMYNTNGEPMHLEGHQFQGFDVRYNYIAFNNAGYRNIFAAFGVQLNFSNNIVFNNTAQCIVNGSVQEMISINQRYIQNSIYDNWAQYYNRSTIFLKSAKFYFTDNFIVNPFNLYEMTTFNRTKTWDGLYPTIQAQNNWWGRGEESYVAGRIWERRDDDNMIGVDFVPFYLTNQSVLQGLFCNAVGKCYPGWKFFGNKCYWYFGGSASYSVAEQLCRINHGRLAWARNDYGRENNLGSIVSQFQFNYDASWRAWIFTDWQRRDTHCPTLRDYKVEYTTCDTLLPFVCERNPYITPQLKILPIVLAAAISGSILLCIALPLFIFSLLKSNQRKEEKIERKEILRSSIRASRDTSRQGGPMTAVQFQAAVDEAKRRRPPISSTMSNGDRKTFNLSGVTMDDSSTDTAAMRAKLDFHRMATPPSSITNGSTVQFKYAPSSYHDSDLSTVTSVTAIAGNYPLANSSNYPLYRGSPANGSYYPQRLENEISQLHREPHAFENRGYLEEYPVTNSFMHNAPPVYDASWTGAGALGNRQRVPSKYDAAPGLAVGSIDADELGSRLRGRSKDNNTDYAVPSDLRNSNSSRTRSRPTFSSESGEKATGDSESNIRSSNQHSSSSNIYGSKQLKPPRPRPKETEM